MKSAILDPSGAQTESKTLEPPRPQDDFFGWKDHLGEPLSFRYDKIIGLFAAGNTGRYAIAVEGVTQPIQLSPSDAMRLMKRMGWRGSAIDNEI